MEIGFNLPISGPMATAETMANIAQLGEALGFAYLTLTDHIALPDTATPGYPYSTSGEFYTPDPGHRVEQLTTAAWVAAKTSKIRIVLAVMVVPHRPAVLAAKTLSTIDVLSGGRLVVGIGAGWLQVELEAVGTTPFAERGAVTDEFMDAMRAIWTQTAAELPRKIYQYRRTADRSEAAPEAVPADLGRRRERPLDAPSGAGRRCLVSDRHATMRICWTRCRG